LIIVCQLYVVGDFAGELTLLVFGAYGPTHLLRSHITPGQAPQQLLHNYVRYAMQHPAMFESIITLSYANMHIPQWVDGQPDIHTTRHYGSTLKRLREALSNQHEIVEDATFLAIIGLIGAEVRIPDTARGMGNPNGDSICSVTLMLIARTQPL